MGPCCGAPCDVLSGISGATRGCATAHETEYAQETVAATLGGRPATGLSKAPPRARSERYGARNAVLRQQRCCGSRLSKKPPLLCGFSCVCSEPGTWPPVPPQRAPCSRLAARHTRRHLNFCSRVAQEVRCGASLYVSSPRPPSLPFPARTMDGAVGGDVLSFAC